MSSRTIRRVLILVLLASAFATSAQEPVAGQAPADQERTVEVEGVGASADDALKDAFSSAIKSCVGALVSSEQMIKNEDVIKDEILTYSKGYIKNYDDLGSGEKNGLVTRRIKATVIVGKLGAGLRSAGIATKAIDGPSLFAEAVTKSERLGSAEQLLKKEIANLPHCLLSASAIGRPQFDEVSGKILLRVQVRSDLAACQRAVQSLSDLLTKMHFARQTEHLVLQNERVDTSGYPARPDLSIGSCMRTHGYLDAVGTYLDVKGGRLFICPSQVSLNTHSLLKAHPSWDEPGTERAMGVSKGNYWPTIFPMGAIVLGRSGGKNCIDLDIYALPPAVARRVIDSFAVVQLEVDLKTGEGETVVSKKILLLNQGPAVLLSMETYYAYSSLSGPLDVMAKAYGAVVIPAWLGGALCRSDRGSMVSTITEVWSANVGITVPVEFRMTTDDMRRTKRVDCVIQPFSTLGAVRGLNYTDRMKLESRIKDSLAPAE